MDSRFDILVTVNFSHAYFADGRFSGMTVKPDADCASALRSLGLLFKPFASGFRILYDQNFARGQRTRDTVVAGAVTLRFHLFLQDPSFYNYTANLDQDISRMLFYFSNAASANMPVPPAGLLHRGPFVSGDDLLLATQFAGEFFSKPAGILDLVLGKELSVNYSVNFSARATFWRYILVGDRVKGLSNPAILDAGDQEGFDGPAGITLPDSRNAQVFTSRAAISLAQGAGKTFRLVENYEGSAGKYKVILAALPLPDPRIVSAAGSGGTNKAQQNFSEIFIY